MEKVITFTDNGAIRKEAVVWIAKMDGDDFSLDDRDALKEWMTRSPRHKAELQRLTKRWGELNILTELAVPHEKPRTGGILKKTLIGACATAAVLLLALGQFWDSTRVYSTAVGEQRLVTLQDESTMLLNTNSRAKVAYSPERRTVRLLNGEAYFTVTPGAERPFIVYAGNGMVRAVGTAFSVNIKPEGVEVTVTEGSVELNALGDYPAKNPTPADNSIVDENIDRAAILKAGQSATVAQTIQQVETIEQEQMDMKLSWQEGLLRFSGDSLEEVVAEVSRYTSLSIEIRDPKLHDLRIGGIFKVGEIEKMFEALEAGFGIRAERVNENLVVLSSVKP